MSAAQIMPIFVGVFLLFVSGLLLLVVCREIALCVHDRRLPMQTEEVCIVAKHVVAQSMPSNIRGSGGYCAVHCISFKSSTGIYSEFSVSRREYARRVRGEQGLLTFQGTHFKKFVAIEMPDKKRETKRSLESPNACFAFRRPIC